VSLHDRLIERLGRTRFGGFFFVHIASHLDRVALRWSRGRVSTGLRSRFGPNVVLLTAIGARSGRERQTPLLATPVGDRLVLIASNGGGAEHPSWYHNLKKNPRCRVLRWGAEATYLAREVSGDERAALWRAAVDHYAGYADYQSRVARLIPVLVLEPTPS
jgi:deazaflavin-dependent oxidoreductase (nitroreductase family)